MTTSESIPEGIRFCVPSDKQEGWECPVSRPGKWGNATGLGMTYSN